MSRSLNSPNCEGRILGQLSRPIRNDSTAPEAPKQKKFLAREDSYADSPVLTSNRFECSNRFPPRSDEIPLFLSGALAYRLANQTHLPPSEAHQRIVHRCSQNNVMR